MIHPLHALREELQTLHVETVEFFHKARASFILMGNIMPAIDTLTTTVASLTDAVGALPARIAAEIAAAQTPSATDAQILALNDAVANLTSVVNSIAQPTA